MIKLTSCLYLRRSTDTLDSLIRIVAFIVSAYTTSLSAALLTALLLLTSLFSIGLFLM